MTSNEKVLEKPSVIMTVAFRNVRVLLYALKCFKLFVKLKQVVSKLIMLDMCKFYFHGSILACYK